MKMTTALVLGSLAAFAASATTVEIASPDGGRAAADTYGARLVNWRPAGGEEGFALPKPYDKCPREAGVQIHGGLPIYWPWFVFEGPEGCKIHGVTSYAEWKVKDHTASRVVFALDDTPATRAVWPHSFHAELAYELGPALTATFTVVNTGSEPYACTEGFHPYFRVGDTMRCTVTGTDGARYFWKGEADKGDRRRWKGDFPACLVAVGKPGYVFEEKDGPHRHLLKDPVLNRAIDVTYEGNIKLVMWNSGPDFSKFGSADDPSYGSRFLCMEGATLYRDRAYVLAPGASHTLKATIAVRPFKSARFAMEGLSPAVYYDAAHAVTAGDRDADLGVIVVHGWGGGVKPAARDTLQANLATRVPPGRVDGARREAVHRLSALPEPHGAGEGEDQGRTRHVVQLAEQRPLARRRLARRRRRDRYGHLVLRGCRPADRNAFRQEPLSRDETHRPPRLLSRRTVRRTLRRRREVSIPRGHKSGICRHRPFHGAAAGR